MKTQITVAVVEDDENLRFLVTLRLLNEGYRVIQAADGEEAQAMILEQRPSVVLLDWMLPGKEGIEVCEAVRKAGFEEIIIMMTAKAQDVDKIDAYSHGVTDYITKPFSMDVLVAMIENKVRYFPPKHSDVYTFSDIEYRPSIHLLQRRDGTKIDLTILENRILLYFVQHPGKEITRENLMNIVWGYTPTVNTRTLDMHVVRLRKKVEKNPDSPKFIRTVRGMGYMFVDNSPAGHRESTPKT